jgi:hypothetical protein
MDLKQETLERLDSLIEKATKVLATHQPIPNAIGYPTLDPAAFSEWQTQSLAYLINMLGNEHVYVKQFTAIGRKGFRNALASGQGILRAVRQDIEGGYLKRVEDLVSAEVFTDFLDMAEHLLAQGYKDPAASLIGAVLEDGLRRICVKNSLSLNPIESINSLNKKLADAQVYNRLIQKKVHVWNDVRNNADHGKFSEYSIQDAKEMAKGVRDFLAQLLV